MEEEIKFYDTRMWRMLKNIKYKHEVESFIWDRSGAAFFVTDAIGNISIFDGQSLEIEPEITLSSIHRKSRCQCIEMHPSNEFFVTGGNDSLIAFWDFEELLCTGTVRDNSLPVKALKFSPCGTYLAAIGQEDRPDQEKRCTLEVFDTEQRLPVAA